MAITLKSLEKQVKELGGGVVISQADSNKYKQLVEEGNLSMNRRVTYGAHTFKNKIAICGPKYFILVKSKDGKLYALENGETINIDVEYVCQVEKTTEGFVS